MPTGGLITINAKNHKKISTDLKEKRWCGISNRKGTKYDVKNVGWNYYMNEFSAAIGIEQLKKLNRSNKVRQAIAKKYSNKINLEHKMPFKLKADTDVIAKVASAIMASDDFQTLKKK